MFTSLQCNPHSSAVLASAVLVEAPQRLKELGFSKQSHHFNCSSISFALAAAAAARAGGGAAAAAGSCGASGEWLVYQDRLKIMKEEKTIKQTNEQNGE